LMYIYSALQLFLAKAGLFFPVVAVLFLLLLYKLYRRFTRPSYN
jgi:hypothetical protein